MKVSEDELLLAEVRSVGADECQQAIAEAERDLPDAGNLESQDVRTGLTHLLRSPVTSDAVGRSRGGPTGAAAG